MTLIFLRVKYFVSCAIASLVLLSGLAPDTAHERVASAVPIVASEKEILYQWISCVQNIYNSKPKYSRGNVLLALFYSCLFVSIVSRVFDVRSRLVRLLLVQFME